MGCFGIARVVLILINVIFFIIGGASLGLGIWVLKDKTSLITYLTKISTAVNAYDIPSLLSSAAYIFLVAGAVIFAIAFVGCCGAWKKIKCLLIIYAVIVGIIILMEVAVIVVAYFFMDKVQTYLLTYMQSALWSKYNSSLTALSNSSFTYSYGNDLSLAIDIVQMQFSCCGILNGSDYANTTGWTKTLSGTSSNVTIPASCCQMTGSGSFITLIQSAASGNLTLLNSTCPITTYGSNYNTGCYSAIVNSLKTSGTIVLAIGASILGLQLLLVIFACCVCKGVDKEKVSV